MKKFFIVILSALVILNIWEIKAIETNENEYLPIPVIVKEKEPIKAVPIPYTVEISKQPKEEPKKLITCTAYTIPGSPTATGSYREEGIAASTKENLYKTIAVWKTDGEYLGTWELLDTGYGKATGKGQSEILSGKTLGDIETGETIDFRFATMNDCYEFMKLTHTGKGRSGSQVLIRFVED